MTTLPIDTVAVLAGGLATRMRPLTEMVPKSMLEVAGEPFIIHQLRIFKREGLRRVVLCVGYLGEQIRDRIGDGTDFGLAGCSIPSTAKFFSAPADRCARRCRSSARRRSLSPMAIAIFLDVGL